MPKYELMFIIGSDTSEDDIPAVVSEVRKEIEAKGGRVEKLDELGKKKLAYPIKHTKNGYYVLVQFTTNSQQANQIEAAVRANPAVIRHLLLNIDEALRRTEKDRQARAKMKPRKAPAEEKPDKEKKDKPKVEIDLDAEIEKALDTDELK